MNLTRKQRREAAAKNARTIQPVAVAGSTEGKLREAYAQIEDVEDQNYRLQRELDIQREDYMDLEQQSHNRIEAMANRAWHAGLVCAALGVCMGAALTYLPW